MRRIVNSWLVGAALLLFLVPFAFSQDSVTLELESGGNYTMDGVYVGPYTANQTANGQTQSASIICDDFKDEVVPGESWTANITSYSTLASTGGNTTGLMFNGYTAGGALLDGVSGNALQGYVAIAYLSSEMLPLVSNPANAQQIGYLAYAIWAIFEPSQVQSWLGSGSAAWTAVEGLAQGALSGALKNLYTASTFAGWEILTPVAGSQNPGTQGLPQEYLEFVPEGGTALMYLLLGGVCCFGTMFLKSRRRGAVSQVL